MIEKLKNIETLYGDFTVLRKDDLSEIIERLEQADRMREALEGVAPYLNAALDDDGEDGESIGWQHDPMTGVQEEIPCTYGAIRKVNDALNAQKAKP